MSLDWSGLQQALQEQFLSANVFYALLVEGTFTGMRARSVRKQATGRWGCLKSAEEHLAAASFIPSMNALCLLTGFGKPAVANLPSYLLPEVLLSMKTEV